MSKQPPEWLMRLAKNIAKAQASICTNCHRPILTIKDKSWDVYDPFVITGRQRAIALIMGVSVARVKRGAGLWLQPSYGQYADCGELVQQHRCDTEPISSTPLDFRVGSSQDGEWCELCAHLVLEQTGPDP